MNRYILIRRLRGPAFLLLVGVLALLHQADHDFPFWHLFWPLFLILLGVFMLAERAALAADGGYPQTPYAGTPYPGAPYPGSPYPNAPFSGDPYGGGSYSGVANPGSVQPATTASSTSIVPAHSHDFDKDPDGGQS